MKRPIAALLCALLGVMSPGSAGWLYAAQVVVPRISGNAVPAAGAGTAIGLQVPGQTIGTAPGSLGVSGRTGFGSVLPSGQAPSIRTAPSLALPVSPALRAQAQPIGVVQAPAAGLGASRAAKAPRAGSILPDPAAVGSAVRTSPSSIKVPLPAAAGRGIGRGLLNALRLPSLFGSKVGGGVEGLKNAGESDFLIHAGGQAGAGGSARGAAGGGGARSFAGRYASASPAAAVSPSGPLAGGSPAVSAFGRAVPARAGGTMVLQVPDGRPRVLSIQRADGKDLQSPAESNTPAYSGGPVVWGPADAVGISGIRPAAGFFPRLSPRSLSRVPNGVAARDKTGDFAAKARREKTMETSPRTVRVLQFFSARFSGTLALISAGAFLLLAAVPRAAELIMSYVVPSGLADTVTGVPGLGVVGTVLGAAATAAAVTTGLFGAVALWELGLFGFAVASRDPVSEEEFWRYARKELKSWDLHPSVKASLLGTGPGQGMLKVYRPRSRFAQLAFAFTSGSAVYMRPELIRAPWIFRMVLRHELTHLRVRANRGPPAKSGRIKGLAGLFLSEVGARVRDFLPGDALKDFRLPILQRVLSEAHVSLNLRNPFETLIVHPGNHEVRNPNTFEELSEGHARVLSLMTDAEGGYEARAGEEGRRSYAPPNFPPNAAALEKFFKEKANQNRFRLIVYPQSFGVLPSEESPQAGLLQDALRRMDDIYLMSKRLEFMGKAAFPKGAAERVRLDELAESVLGRSISKKNSVDQLDAAIQAMMLKTARESFKDLDLAKIFRGLYGSLKPGGTALFPFAMGEPGLERVQRIMRYWRAADGGGFSVSRVDLPEGGHVMVARKFEPRVDLWLKPKNGGRIAESTTRVFNRSPEEQESFLVEAGFGEGEIERFRDAGLIVKHVFSAEHGNRIFVSVRRKAANELKKYGEEEGIAFNTSRGGYRLHLIESGPVQSVPQAWKLGLDGAGGKIYDIDTGLDTTHPDFADRDLKSVDFVDEGPEDWIGHGTHKAGISYANGTVYKGMAPKAEGRMGKVFAQNGFGANDGDIMAAAIDAMQWGADVISLSLGSPGTVDARLSEFFSQLTRKKNANGEYPIVTASAGNSGPFNATKSQPSAGELVMSVTAAAKSLDDHDPEIAFYSSVGPGIDGRFSRKRVRRIMGITAIGGDVTTPPGVRDVYADGVESVKSKDMAPSPSDADDGLHTRMSGTSMSNPMVAGIALLVKHAVQRVVKAGTAAHEFFTENLPFAVNMILMRSSRDMRVPLYFQEAGMVDALAAVEMGAGTFGGVLSWPRKIAALGLRMIGLGRVKSLVERRSPGEEPWDWIRRAKAVWDLEDRVYRAAEEAKDAAVKSVDEGGAGHVDAPSEDPQVVLAVKQKMGQEGMKAFDAKFAEARAEALPEFLEALKDGVWLNRMYAAMALMNLKAPEAVLELADTALNDEDGRVRQAAFLALAETPSYEADEALKRALDNARPDVRMYAAYALARHGDISGVERITAEMRSDDKMNRHTAVWLVGQIRQRAPPAAAEALAARVSLESERGNIRHLAAASLTEIALAHPESITNETVLKMLSASGRQNFALTRTISKFFTAAARSEEVRGRMQKDPLRDAIVSFIHKNKGAVNGPGALGQMVKLLAKIVNVPLSLPTPPPNKAGEGVPGVDPNLGPVHLIVELPEGKPTGPRVQGFQDYRGAEGQQALASAIGAYGLDLATLERYDAKLQVAMPVSQSLWVELSDAKVMAFQAEMEKRGFRVSRATPMYRLLHETGPASGMPAARETRGLSGQGVLVAYLDEGGDTKHPALAEERVKAKRSFSEDLKPEEVEDESVSHGTHGMGIVGAASVDESPYVGMAPGVDFAIGKVLGAYGGSDATVMAGLEWAASLVKDPLKNPVIVNMSLGGPGAPDSPIGRLVNKLRLANIGVVAAVGNSGPTEGTVSSPANAPLATAVGAVDKKGALAEYSSRSPKSGESEVSWVDFGGGVFFGLPNPYDIVSALNTRLAETLGRGPTGVPHKGKRLYHAMSGTSMAAPHTTGKLALLTERMAEKLGALPDGYMFYLEDLVIRTAKAMKDNGDNEVGAGMIDAEKALEVLDKELENPGAVAAKSAEFIKQAREKYGKPEGEDSPSKKPSWMGPFSRMPELLGANLWGLLTLWLPF